MKNLADPPAAEVSKALITWFRRAKRDLPWRRTRDPYAILVSEIMLQQTQVATALGYYDRFLERFPDLRALAEARPDDVMSAWAGLGYYRRATMLHRLASIIVSENGGRFPRTVSGIQKLPGIGRYTAGAVASFAFGVRAPIVEANSARVLARLFAIELDLKSAQAQGRLWRHAEQLLPTRNVREHNYAIMELGALVCTPMSPRCGGCPVQPHCRAFARRRVESIPMRPDSPAQKVRRAFVGIVLERGGRFLMRRIPVGEWHAGLYEFPKFPVEPDSAPSAQLEALRASLGALVAGTRPEPYARFQFTITCHSVDLAMWRASAWRAPRRAVAEAAFVADCAWYLPEEIRRLPLPAVQKRIVNILLNDCDLVTKMEMSRARRAANKPASER